MKIENQILFARGPHRPGLVSLFSQSPRQAGEHPFMKKTRSLISGIFIALALSGCVMVPKTIITGSLGGAPFTFSGPKNCTLGSMVITAGTNGSLSLVISNLQTIMDPAVITTTGDAQAKLITATANGVIQRMAAAAAKAP